jgi:hypothetical protein
MVGEFNPDPTLGVWCCCVGATAQAAIQATPTYPVAVGLGQSNKIHCEN